MKWSFSRGVCVLELWMVNIQWFIKQKKIREFFFLKKWIGSGILIFTLCLCIISPAGITIVKSMGKHGSLFPTGLTHHYWECLVNAAFVSVVANRWRTCRFVTTVTWNTTRVRTDFFKRSTCHPPSRRSSAAENGRICCKIDAEDTTLMDIGLFCIKTFDKIGTWNLASFVVCR